MRAFIAQVERVNPKVNAIVTFLPDEALKAAKAFDRKRQKLPLGGLPIAIKDVIATKGVRTTGARSSTRITSQPKITSSPNG